MAYFISAVLLYCCLFRAFIVSLANHNTVRIFRIGKKEDGSPGNITAALDFPKVTP